MSGLRFAVWQYELYRPEKTKYHLKYTKHDQEYFMANVCTDRLDALLAHFPVHARVFHAGALCEITEFEGQGEGGQLHLVSKGVLDAIHPGQPSVHVAEPSLLLYPRPCARRFITDGQHGAALVCADLHFEGGASNPVANALPDVVCLPLKAIEHADQVLALLFAEAFGDNCGRREVVDRLFDIVLIQVLRHLMETGLIRSGLLAGMSHPKLRKALVAMHEQPAQAWSLEALAQIAGMSRSIFASTFKATVGSTSGVYLQAWRVRLAQKALRQGQQLKMIADDVGYGSEAALSRAFKAQCGLAPREWKQANH
jgi:AraC-like DNA-binding protein